MACLSVSADARRTARTDSRLFAFQSTAGASGQRSAQGRTAAENRHLSGSPEHRSALEEGGTPGRSLCCESSCRLAPGSNATVAVRWRWWLPPLPLTCLPAPNWKTSSWMSTAGVFATIARTISCKGESPSPGNERSDTLCSVPGFCIASARRSFSCTPLSEPLGSAPMSAAHAAAGSHQMPGVQHQAEIGRTGKLHDMGYGRCVRERLVSGIASNASCRPCAAARCASRGNPFRHELRRARRSKKVCDVDRRHTECLRHAYEIIELYCQFRRHRSGTLWGAAAPGTSRVNASVDC